jgi:hypothetical protein
MQMSLINEIGSSAASSSSKHFMAKAAFIALGDTPKSSLSH